MAWIVKSTIAFLGQSSATWCTMSALLMAGVVVGWHMMVVTPPAAAARVRVLKSSLWVWPGSLVCTWQSTQPGRV